MHKLVIKNFGPISDAEIEVGDLTIIIGEQATGKSTISKLIYFFQSLKEDALKAAVFSIERQVENPTKVFKREIQQKFVYFFKPAYFQENTHIRYFFSKDSYFEVKALAEDVPDNEKKAGKNLSSKRGFLMDVNAKREFWNRLDATLFQIKEQLQVRTTSLALLNEAPQGKIKKLLDDLFPQCQEGLYLPAGRNISVGYSEQFEQYFRDRLFLGLNSATDLLQADENNLPTADMFLLEKFMARVADLKDRFREAGGSFREMLKSFRQIPDFDEHRARYMDAVSKRVGEILRGEYRADGSAERIQFKNKKFIWLREASSGQQESIRIMQDMMLLTRTGVPVFRAIEEPEAHLFPLAQQHLIELVALAQAATGSQFVLTTHSPYIVSSVNNILFSSQLSAENGRTALPMLNPTQLRGYMLTRDADTGEIKAESLLKDMGRMGQPLLLMGHTSLDAVAEQMGATFGELRLRYRNQTPTPSLAAI